MPQGHPIAVQIAVTHTGQLYVLDALGRLWRSGGSAPTMASDFTRIRLPKEIDPE